MAANWLRCALGLTEPGEPFPWQVELLRRFCRGDAIPSIDIPTGMGKTGVMAVWLVARALGANLPRRLVYVVDRRAVVDQATKVAEALRAWVAKEPGVADALNLFGRLLPISTLRGQHVDNREWLEDPSSPAIVVGTVDMVGSRLLFEGYGVSSKMRPYHAGMLGADTLVVLDEAHLVPAFEDLVRQIELGVEHFGATDPSHRSLIPPFKVLSLSATGRQSDAKTLTLSDADRNNTIVKSRLTAEKALRIVDLASTVANTANGDNGADKHRNTKATAEIKGFTLPEVLAYEAWQLKAKAEQGGKPRCLVFCDTRKDAIAVRDALHDMAKLARESKPIVELFVGGRRVMERTMVAKWLVDHGFVERDDGTRAEPQGPTFLVATSAGEVGVDIDADHMVCDLVTWERMVQRLGRVNRRGGTGRKSEVVVVVRAGPADEATLRAEAETLGDKFPKDRRRLLDLFNKRNAATSARAQLAQAGLSSSERNSLNKKLGSFKDADAKKLAEYESQVATHNALRELLNAAAADGGSLSPESLLKLRARPDLANAVLAATAVAPLRPELTRALVDAWSMTSLDEHLARPKVDPWLRGFLPNDPPQTIVVWRRHLPVRADGFFDAEAAKRFFDAAPPHASEQLETETHLVHKWLIERAATLCKAKGEDGLEDSERVVAIALGKRGELRGWRTLNQLAAGKSKGKNEDKEAKKAREQDVEELGQLLVGATLVVDARLGGLCDGLLSEQTNTTAEASDDGVTVWLTRPDVQGVPVTGFLARAMNANEKGDFSSKMQAGRTGWILRHMFATSVVDGEPSAALLIHGWNGDATNEEERAEADRSQRLDEHQSWTEDCAKQIAKRLGIDTKFANLLALAARLHDEGKRAVRWQRAFKAPIEDRPYAKTKGPIDFDLLDGYRHEFGSLPYVEAHNDFKALDEDDQELVLHLIAAHHGFARPVIGTNGCDDAPPSVLEERARTVALRFARLSRHWGPWGLAWLEALLRAADQTASRSNQKAATEQKEQA